MRKDFRFTFVYLVLGSVLFCAAQTATAADYIVRKGDSLSSIAREHYGEPVYGANGTIHKIFKLNPSFDRKTVLEPGQKVILDGKSAGKVAERPAESKQFESPRAAHPAFEEVRLPAAVGVDAPPLEDEKPEPLSPAIETALAAARAGSTPMKKVGPASEEAPPVVHVETDHAAEAKHETHEGPGAVPPHHEVDEAPDNFISVVLGYSQIKQTVNDPASGTSYAMNSSPALSLELGWDHSWSRSFSTLLTYSGMQFTSQETSAASGALVAHDLYTSKFELALFNHLTHWVRFGLGAAYGDHVFIENFTGIPADPQLYKTAFFNPFVAAEFTPYETKTLDLLFNVKIGELPAQNGLGHDLAAGTEFFGEIALVEKFEHWAMTYGLSYSSEDQTRTDSTETRNEWALRVGAMF